MVLPQQAMNQQIVKDSQKYAFAQCLVWQTTRCLIPQWDFQRLVLYTPLYTDNIQKFTMGSHHLSLYSNYLPTAEMVLHRYKKVLQPIVRYQMTIGYDALELLVFGTFLGFFCARLHVAGIKEAPDYAVISIANALKFFDDTDQFEDDGWTRLDAWARELISTPENEVNKIVSTSKMGERIEKFLSDHLKVPRRAHVADSSKIKAVSYITGSYKYDQIPKTTELQKNNPTPYSNGLQKSDQTPYTNGLLNQTPYTNGLQKHQAPYTTANFNDREPTTVGCAASAVDREQLLGISQMDPYHNIRTGPLYYYVLQK